VGGGEGHLPAAVYRRCTIYSTLSPNPMCSGAIQLYGIPKVVIGENKTFQGPESTFALKESNLKSTKTPSALP
jgi:cytosine deaminase